ARVNQRFAARAPTAETRGNRLGGREQSRRAPRGHRRESQPRQGAPSTTDRRMITHHRIAGAALLTVAAAACAGAGGPMPRENVASPHAEALARNPLLAEWSGPYGGVPPWDQVRPEDFPEA